MTEKRQDVDAVLSRIGEALGAASEDAWMAQLAIPQETVRTWRKRGAVPLRQLSRIAETTGKTVDWLINGPSFFGHKEKQITYSAQEQQAGWGRTDEVFAVAELVLELIEHKGMRLPPRKVVELMRVVYDYKQAKVTESMEGLRQKTDQFLRLVA